MESSGWQKNTEPGGRVAKPKIYKENGVYICEHKQIRVSGTSVVEAFLNFILAKASSHLHSEETKL